jgi:hypothetical protein
VTIIEPVSEVERRVWTFVVEQRAGLVCRLRDVKTETRASKLHRKWAEKSGWPRGSGRPVAEPTPAEVPESVRAAVFSEIANKLAFTVGYG